MPNHPKLHSFHPSHPYPYGMMMPDRDWSSESGYRFGFSGQEFLDDAEGNQIYSFEHRIYDSRIARFSSVDPLTIIYPFWSPFVYAGNTPIQAIDFEGLETFYETYLENTGDDPERLEARLEMNQTPIPTLVMLSGGIMSLGFSVAPVATLAFLGEEIFEELSGVPILPTPNDIVERQVRNAAFEGVSPNKVLPNDPVDVVRLKRQNYSKQVMKRDEFVRNVDFNKHVYKIELKEDEILYQYRLKTIDGVENDKVGSFYVRDKTVKPEEVGLVSNDYELYEVVVGSESDALVTTHISSSEKSPVYYYRDNSTVVEGGGEQLFIENLKVKSSKRIE